MRTLLPALRWPVLAIVVSLLRPVAAAAQDADAIGWLTEREGVVERRHTDAEPWVAIEPATALATGDRVRTVGDAKAKLLLRDDSVLALAADSELTLDEQTAGPVPRARLALLQGKVRALVTERYGAPGSTFELQTTNAITGVRGTSFVASYDPAAEETLVVGVIDTTTVRARRDSAAGHAVRLGPGEASRVRRGSYPTRPARISDATLKNLLGATTIRPAPGTGASGGKGPVAEPRLPRGAGDRSGSPEGRTIDQPIELLRRRGGVPPPPPPVPR